jgi:hypothetical protein
MTREMPRLTGGDATVLFLSPPRSGVGGGAARLRAGDGSGRCRANWSHDSYGGELTMMRLLLTAVFTLGLAGLSNAQQGPATENSGSEIHVRVSVGSDGEVKVGTVRVREGSSSGSNAGRTSPSRDTNSSSGGAGSGGARRDPWEGLRGPNEGGSRGSEPRESGTRGGRRHG